MESLRLQNIKSYKDSGEIELKPLTILVGKNSCGKSSLLRFPAVLSQSMKVRSNSPIVFFGEMLDYGSYEEIVHKGKDGDISFSLTYKMPLEEYRDYRAYLSEFRSMEEGKNFCKEFNVTTRISINREEKYLVLKHIEVLVDGESFFTMTKKKNNVYELVVTKYYVTREIHETDIKCDVEVTGMRLCFPVFRVIECMKILFKQFMEQNGFTYDAETFVKYYRNFRAHYFSGRKARGGRKSKNKEELFVESVFPVIGNVADLLDGISNRFRNELINLKYIGPFRTQPERTYRDPEYDYLDVGVHGENVSTFLYHNADNDWIGFISSYLKEIIGYGLEVKDIGNGLFQIMLVDEHGVKSNIIDTGYGVSQVLPIIIQVLYSMMLEKMKTPGLYMDRMSMETKPDNIILLEQPELHLHPAAQAALGGFLGECAVKNDRNLKLMIETHSEHLIRKLQVMVADKDCPLTKDMVKIYYVEKNEEGEATVKEMKLTDKGKFEDEWPTGFFDQAVNLGYALMAKNLEKR